MSAQRLAERLSVAVDLCRQEKWAQGTELLREIERRIESHERSSMDRAADARLREVRGQALRWLAEAARHRGDAERARSRYCEAIEVLRSAERPALLAHTLRHLAEHDSQIGNHEAARAASLEALSLTRDTAAPGSLELANALRVAALAHERGEGALAESAIELWNEALCGYQSNDVEAGVAESAARMARLFVQFGKRDRAVAAIEVARRAASRDGGEQTLHFVEACAALL